MAGTRGIDAGHRDVRPERPLRGAAVLREEGFNELFSAVQLDERYDLAIMSTKGVSVTAARRLVDQLCARYQLSLFVLHDFDVSGFTILKTLQSDTVAIRSRTKSM